VGEVLADKESGEEEGDDAGGDDEEQKDKEIAFDGPPEQVLVSSTAVPLASEQLVSVGDEVVPGEKDLDVEEVEVELFLAEHVAKGDEVEWEVVEEGKKK
jgi:hypothetical protein